MTQLCNKPTKYRKCFACLQTHIKPGVETCPNCNKTGSISEHDEINDFAADVVKIYEKWHDKFQFKMEISAWDGSKKELRCGL